jgi:hypothetical protein
MTYQYTYFLDRALGKSVGYTLRSLGVNLAFHHEHFLPDAPDLEWLPIVSQRGWVVLTKDANIGRNVLEVQQIARYQAKVFVLVSASLSRQQMVDIFVNSIDNLERITQGNNAPFIAKIYRSGKVTIWKNKIQLNKLLK